MKLPYSNKSESINQSTFETGRERKEDGKPV